MVKWLACRQKGRGINPPGTEGTAASSHCSKTCMFKVSDSKMHIVSVNVCLGTSLNVNLVIN